MNWSSKLILLILMSFVSCNSTPNLYSTISKNQDVNMSKNMLLIIYKPLECLSCNAGVSSIFSDKNIKSQYGDNIFFMYNGIRDIELKDYKSNFMETVGIDAKMINDKDLYEQTLKSCGIKKEGLKPTCIVLYKNNKKPKVENMKDADILHLLTSQ